MSSNKSWQEEVSPEKWDEWLRLAQKLSKAKKVNTSLGYEDYAAQAIEILLQQEKKPANIEGWLALTIKRQYIHRFRKIQARGGASVRDLTDAQWEEEMISRAAGSPSILVRVRESVTEVLDVLNLKEKEILILAAAGYDNHAIAMHLDYANNKIVATRLGQIEQKVKKAIKLIDLNPN
jgi:DNA-directed RNA polymerase specialized sigma24 family protein